MGEYRAWPPPGRFWRRCGANVRWQRRQQGKLAAEEALEAGRSKAAAAEAARLAAHEVRPVAMRVETLDAVQLQLVGLSREGSDDLMGGDDDPLTAPRRTIKQLLTGRMPDKLGEWAVGGINVQRLHVVWELTFDVKEVLLQEALLGEGGTEGRSALEGMSVEQLEARVEAPWEREARRQAGCEWDAAPVPEDK